jgi:hypothetical protein
MLRVLLPSVAVLTSLLACSDERAPEPAAAAPTEPAKPTPAPAEPSPAPAVATGPNPCANPEPQTLVLEAAIPQTTASGLELSYAIDEDDKRGPGYMFLLRHGQRRWQMRRDNTNWSSPKSWRGFCWRGGKRPAKRASSIEVQVAPVCEDGELVELGGCGDVFASP